MGLSNAERQRNYQLRHPDRVKQAAARYHASERGKKKRDEYYQKNKERISAYSRAHSYGVTSEQYQEMVERGCDICGKKTQHIVVDHSHSTGKVRGGLCRRHNLLVTTLDVMAEEMNSILKYLGK